MPLNRGLFPKSGMGASPVSFEVAVLGAGAAAPTVPPIATYPGGLNGISRLTADIPTRSATGVYVLKLSQMPPVIRNILPSIRGADGRKCTITSWSVADRTITIKTWSVAGIAADIETTDLLILTVEGSNSKSAS